MSKQQPVHPQEEDSSQCYSTGGTLCGWQQWHEWHTYTNAFVCAVVLLRGDCLMGLLLFVVNKILVVLFACSCRLGSGC